MKLVNSLVHHFAKAFSTLLSVTFPVVAPRCDAFRFFSSVLTSVSVLISLENNCCIFHHNSVIYLWCSLSTSTKKKTWSSIDPGSFKNRLSFADVPTSSAYCSLFLTFLCRQHTLKRIIIACCDPTWRFSPIVLRAKILIFSSHWSPANGVTVKIAVQRN